MSSFWSNLFRKKHDEPKAPIIADVAIPVIPPQKLPENPEVGVVWVKIEDNPHAGIASLDDCEVSPFPKAVKITGVTLQWAKDNLTGKVMKPKHTDGLVFSSSQIESLVK